MLIDPQEFLRAHPPVLSDGLMADADNRQDADTHDDTQVGTTAPAGRPPFHRRSSQKPASPGFPDKQGDPTGRAAGHGTAGSDSLPSEDSSQDCFDAAVRSLSAADATVYMLRQRLRRKEFSDEDIELTITRLSDAGLLDDEHFGEDLLERCLRRSMGPAGARREFRRKGLDDALADRLIGEAEDSGRFDESARSFVEAFRPEADRLDRQTALRRLASRAASRGLPSGLVRAYAAELLGL